MEPKEIIENKIGQFKERREGAMKEIEWLNGYPVEEWTEDDWRNRMYWEGIAEACLEAMYALECAIKEMEGEGK